MVVCLSVACHAQYPVGDSVWDKTFTFEVKDMPLRDAAKQLADLTGIRCEVDPGVPDTTRVTVSVKAANLWTIAYELAHAAGCIHEIIGDTLRIMMYPRLGQAVDATSPGGSWDKVVNLEAKDMPLTEAVQQLLKDTGLSYTIDPSVAAVTVTLSFKAVKLDVALRELVRAAGCVYRLEGDSIVAITARPAVTNQTTFVGPRPPFQPPPGDVAVVETQSRGESLTETVPLRFADPSEVAPILGRLEGLDDIRTTNTGLIVLTGDEEGIERAKKMIRMLDSLNTAKPVSIKLILTVKVTEPKKPTRKYVSSTGSVGPEGVPALLQIEGNETKAYTLTAKPGAPLQFQNFNAYLGASLVPRILDSGDQKGKQTVTLSGTGSVRGAFPVSSVKDSVTFSKEFETAVSLVSGVPASIASGSTDGGSAKIEFDVTASAEVGKGLVEIPRQPPAQGYGNFGSYNPGYGAFNNRYGSYPGGSSYGVGYGKYGGYPSGLGPSLGGSYGGSSNPPGSPAKSATPGKTQPKDEKKPSSGGSSSGGVGRSW
jgi:hypothetical protein